MKQQIVTINGPQIIKIGNELPMVLIAGPCAIEGKNHALETAHMLKEITSRIGIKCVYKSSFDKANRTSSKSYRGVGMSAGLDILAEVREKCGLAVTTDIHLPEQADPIGNVVDMIQIPAFLCRQTDLLLAAAKTGKPINIKKGQFLAPDDMQSVVEKIASAGNNQICLCERGTFFGYHNLVVDMRAIPIMKNTGCPVVFDATHSVQLPGAQGSSSGGRREFVFPLAKAATSIGIAALFMETHQDPDKAPCDGPNMLPVNRLGNLLVKLMAIDRIAKDEE